ncbi:efflux RND transporter periplasmic adaptor subunit [Candidatus Thiosymbion oneisti]|uniref:efflux RND transporter periplasmic adaptor subunit n=1 Tax=Candidatus Thiosymbion oneisti TaxID=589554 RepID=UPI000B2B5581|nr:efflux RND transporter periplasmic adaptor subunit [Candidatus Thiosymbion oneisti]
MWFPIPPRARKVGTRPSLPMTPCAGESVVRDWPQPGLILTLALLLTGCGADDESRHTHHQQGPSREHLVTVFRAERAPVAARHEHPGSLRFRRLVRIHSQEEGRITELEVFEGDLIAQDNLLARLEDDLLRAQLDKARATKRQKQLDLQRQEGLRSRRAVSEDELAQARTALTVAQAEERVLETRLAFTRIRAPFTGVITERHVEPGDFVTKNSHLLTLADPASLIAEVYASELVLPQLEPGDLVELRIDALGPDRFEGQILRIHPALARTSRQAIVEVAMDPIPEGARAGQFVRATLGIAALYRLLVPFRAVRRDRDGEFLWLLSDENQVERRPVRTGLRITDRIEILEGLEPGERVVTRGFLGLAEGKSVQVVENSP